MEQKKKCNKCKIKKILSDFSKDKTNKDSLQGKCKSCSNKFYKDNREEKLEKSRECYKKNKKEKNAYAKSYYYKNTERFLIGSKKYRENNIEKVRKYHNKWRAEKRKTDPLFKLNESLRNMMYRTFQSIGTKKTEKTFDLLKYNPNNLKLRLEYQFTDKMNWNNYGEYWEIDHIKPIDKFIKQGETRPHIINALSNLRPLSIDENRSKGNTF